MKHPLYRSCLFALTSTLIACGGESADNRIETEIQLTPENPSAVQDEKTLSFSIDVSRALNSGISASRVEVSVYNDLLQRKVTADVVDQTASVSFSELPLGSYSIAVEVYDGETLIANGSGNAQVTADNSTSVSLVLNPITGNLDVAICLPDISTQYFVGSASAELLHSETSALDASDSEPAAQAYHLAFDGVTQLEYSYRVGDSEIPVVQGDETTPLHTDHGARLTVGDGENTLMELAGCNTQLLITKGTNKISLWFAMPQTYNGEISIQVQGITLGSIISENLAMVVTLEDANSDAGIESAVTLSDIDLTLIDSQTLTLGVPLPSELTGSTGLLLSDPDSIIDQEFYYSQAQ